MNTECNYSYADLYRSAYGKNPTELILKKFTQLPQSGKNNLVKKWAKKAKWQTRRRKGYDGKLYIAFAPNF